MWPEKKIWRGAAAAAMDNSREKEVVAVAAADEEGAALPGFRFHPTDEELVAFYLRRKVEKRPIRIEIIKQVDIYKYDPWDLPRVSNVGDDKEWYFFCPRGRKYRNSVRPNRVTGSGFWKATGIDRPIHAAGGNHDCVGLKKSLVYYRGSAGKGVKTDWMMHEFRLPTGGGVHGVNNNCTPQEAGETWTICRIFKRHVSYKRQAQSWRSSDTSTKQAPSCGLSSKTCSAGESNSDDDDSRQLQDLPAANWNFQQICDNTTSVVITGGEDKTSQACADQRWNSSPVSYDSFPVQDVNVDFLLRDGISWEELGRMAEFAGDPFPAYECRY